MKRRGRPPHPDVLTPREWDVLTLVRDGLTNQQIAERLGISFDAAKYHVGEILSKLQLATREEAAAWRPVPPERPVLRPSWANAAIISVIALTAIGFAVLLVAILSSSGGGGDDDLPLKTTTTSASPSSSPTTSPIALTVQPAITLPPNLSIIMEVGCCETPYTGFVSYSRADGSGLPHRDVLFSAGSHIFITADGSTDKRDEYLAAGGVPVPTPNPQAPFKAPAEDRPYVATYGISSDAQALAIGLCIRGSCEGVNAAPNDQGITQLYESLDSGHTWSELVQLGPYVRVVGVTNAGRVLIANNVLNTKEEEFSWQPDGEVVPLRSTTSGMPTVLGDGRLIWPSLGNWYLQDGSLLATNVPGTNVFNSIIDMNDGRYATNTNDGFVIVANGAVAETYSSTAGVSAYLGNGQFVGMTTVPAPAGSDLVTADVPALIDINARTVTPITSPFLDVGSDQPGFLIIVGVPKSAL